MKNFTILAIVILVVGGIFVLSGNPKTPAKVVPQPTKTDTQVITKTIDIKGLNYAYDLKEIKVKKGDVVKINFTNTDGFHDFKIDEFNVATKQIPAGSTESVSFVADKSGTYEYYCSVGKHRAMGMFGKLIVE